MKYTRAIAVMAAIAMPFSANAMTGAEFLQQNQYFAEGYAWGVAESLVTFYVTKEDLAVIEERHKCLVSANIDNHTLYDAVVEHLRKTPSALVQTAAMSVSSVIYIMCGEKPHEYAVYYREK
jgi:hypothetical protein